MSLLRIPTPLRPYTQGQKQIMVEGRTVAEALQSLARQFPDIEPHLFDETGALRSYVNVFLNDEDVRTLQGSATPIGEEDRIMILPSIAGGAHER